ncbi:Sec63 Brl domain-containing protein [Geopyxis carbonaria]|nr:Sec63 Brl domain-containing protein [Geopyxis carbonaria]
MQMPLYKHRLSSYTSQLHVNHRFSTVYISIAHKIKIEMVNILDLVKDAIEDRYEKNSSYIERYEPNIPGLEKPPRPSFEELYKHFPTKPPPTWNNIHDLERMTRKNTAGILTGQRKYGEPNVQKTVVRSLIQKYEILEPPFSETQFSEPIRDNVVPSGLKYGERQSCDVESYSVTGKEILIRRQGVPAAQGVALLSVEILPERFRSVFKYPQFNAVQSRCYETVYNTEKNIVVSAPTGSGKTAILELAMCSLFGNSGKNDYKVIYMAPTKALCSERKKDWEKRFRNLGLVCTELTGDTDQIQLANVRTGNIIVTTPEKWDSVTRKWTDHKKLLDLVRLFLIDEVHILQESRGAILEVVVSRMKTVGCNVRFIALSATIPNSEDIATWLGQGVALGGKAHLEIFGPEFRPVKLEKHVYGIQSYSNDFAFDKNLNQKLPEVLRNHSSGKPVIIFCLSRSMCVSTAKFISETWRQWSDIDKLWRSPRGNMAFKDSDLQATSVCGIAFHHAGLDVNDRFLVEDLFLRGELTVICCTSTLAVGVNLPAHLVIIKNTVTWADGKMKEYTDIEIMQMLGRAGRPQFDNAGVAVILTKKEKKEHYERMENGTEIVESSLHGNLIEHINAEIGLGTITGVTSAKQWLRSTFLYVRMRKNPQYYKLDGQDTIKDPEKRLESICERDIKSLIEAGLVTETEGQLHCSIYGQSMARLYIKFGTMCRAMHMSCTKKVSDILSFFSDAEEFRELRFRIGEKRLYKEINQNHGMRYPFKGDLVYPAHKVYILVQYAIGRMDFPQDNNLQKYKNNLLQDKAIIFQHCHRIMQCFIDCLVQSCDGIGLTNALELSRCLRAEVWENSADELRQIDGLGPVAVKKLVNSGVWSLKMLETWKPHQIEQVLSRNPPYGSKILKFLGRIPKFEISVYLVGKGQYRADKLYSNIRAEIRCTNTEQLIRYGNQVLYAYFVAQRSDGYLCHFRKIPVFHFNGGKDIQFSTFLNEHDQNILCYITCEQIVGTIQKCELQLSIDKTPASTEYPRVSTHRNVQTQNKSAEVHDECHDPSTTSIAKVGVTQDCSDNEYDTIGYESVFETLTFQNIDDFSQQSRLRDQYISTPESRALHEKHNVDPEERLQLSNGNWQCRHKCLAKPPKEPTQKESLCIQATPFPAASSDFLKSTVKKASITSASKQKTKIRDVRESQHTIPVLDLVTGLDSKGLLPAIKRIPNGKEELYSATFARLPKSQNREYHAESFIKSPLTQSDAEKKRILNSKHILTERFGSSDYY